MADSKAGYGSRKPDEIEDEISRIRDRMGETLSEIERRFRSGTTAAGARAFAEEFLNTGTGTDVRETLDGVTDVVRRNPLPAILIGVGAAWLAYEVYRHRRAPDRGLGRNQAIELLAELTGVARQGAKALRQAAVTVEEGPVREMLRMASIDRGHSAHLLQLELQTLGVDAVHGLTPTGDRLPSWQRVEDLLEEGNTLALLEAIGVAEDETLYRFEEALHDRLPPELRVVIGSRFHEVEGTRARLLSLLEATA